MSRYFDATEYATLAGLGTSPSGTTFYVDGTNGNNSWNGQAATYQGGSTGPWKTITHPFSATRMNYGDHLLIKAGTYAERFYIRNIGGTPSEGNRFKMGAYGDGEVIIKADYNHLLSWSVHSGNVYKFTYNFYIENASRPVRCVVMDDVYNRCYPKTSLGAVTADGHWYWDSGTNTCYLYSSSGTPNSRNVIILPDLSAVSAAYRPVAVIASNVSYINLYGISIKGSPDVGFWDGGNSHHITLDHCRIMFSFNTSARMKYTGNPSGNIVNKCRFYANVYNTFPRGRPCEAGRVNQIGTSPSSSWTRSGFDFGTGMVMRGSIISNHGGEGVNFTGVSDSNNAGAIIEDNIIYDNMSVNIYPDGMDYVTIRRNIIFNSVPLESDIWDGLSTSNKVTARKKMWCQGIMIGFETPSVDIIDNTAIYNNLIVNCRSGFTLYTQQNGWGLRYTKIYGNTIILPNTNGSDALYGMTFRGLDLVGTGSYTRADVDSYVRNNIIIGNHSGTQLITSSSAISGVTINNNCYYHPNNSTPFYYGGSGKTFTQWKAYANIDDSASVNEDPDLVLTDYTAFNLTTLAEGTVSDYALKAGAGAIDIGYTLGSPYNTDFDSVSRPQGAAYDAGALEYVATEEDTTAPATTSDLAAVAGTNPGEIDLEWTAPGNDDDEGTASSYDVRWATAVIDSDAKFNNATQITTGVPTPSVAGSTENMTVSLTAGVTYYFALKTSDESLNISGVSNSPHATATAYPQESIGIGTSTWGTAIGNNQLVFSVTIPDAPHRGLAIGVTAENGTTAETYGQSVLVGSVYATRLARSSERPTTHANTTEIWYLTEEQLPAGQNTLTVTVTMTGTVWAIGAGAIPIYASKQLDPSVIVENSELSADTISSNITTPSANSMVIDCVQSPTVRTDFTATGMDERIDAATTTSRFAMSTRFVAEAGQVTNTWAIDGGAVNSLTHCLIAIEQFDVEDEVPPSAINDLSAVRGLDAGTVILRWTAVGDDEREGTADSYTIKRSTSLITAENFGDATTVSDPPSPSVSGTKEKFIVTGLEGGTPYYFAIKAADADANVGGISNVVSATPSTRSVQHYTGGYANFG
jgi:hypothetical protein